MLEKNYNQKNRYLKMMTTNAKYIFSTIKNSFLPALCFALGLVFFYSYQPYESATNPYLHVIFYCLSFVSLSGLFFVNRSKPFLSLLCGMFCYLLLNNLKIMKGAEFSGSAEFLWLCMLLPLNLGTYYFLPPAKLKNMRNFYLLLLTFAELIFAQNFGEFILQIPYIDMTVGMMPLWITIVWILVLVPIALDISFHNTIVNTGLFYADTALFFGLIYADNASACTTFFLTFSVILSVTAVLDLRHLYRYDYLDGVGSCQSYISQAGNKFPFKYTIALLCIDNREKLFKAIGKRKVKILEQMIVNRIQDFPYEIEIFRHEVNELILVFKNETAKHVMDYAEEIRRTLAGSEFIFQDQDSVKITVSICVSEKTRKDLNAAEVINRAHNTLQKANSLNCNISMKA